MPDKLDFIRRAREAGFFVRVFFVGTDDPSINAKKSPPGEFFDV
jgi:predicted ABC-type ATPase